MLFSSIEFVFGFLPITVLVVMVAAYAGGRRAALLALVAASFIFYAWWNPPFFILLFASIVGNYGAGLVLMRRPSKVLLSFVVIFNIFLIAYFKYAQFLLDIAGDISGTTLNAGNIALPLAISFFTFQQIAFQVDAYRGQIKDGNFLNYCLFVSFFPQLIAGPIIRHGEVMPQYLKNTAFRPVLSNVWVGLMIFVIGLYKKVVIADGISVYANAVFGAAVVEPTLLDAWAGTLTYAFQIYFDFSGYSDMAIGLARIFGIKLPLNFHSPYKATNIIDFWRRWHMTLSRFLRDYLYFPLGGNRLGRGRHSINIMVTMVLGGLWHGAAWTFIFWGVLHGAYLGINHAWRWAKRRFGFGAGPSTAAGRALSRLVTFLAVLVGWVFFRAESFTDAISVLSGMIGLNGIVLPAMTGMATTVLLVDPAAYVWLVVILAIVWMAPNTQEWLADHDPVLDDDRHLLADSIRKTASGTSLFGTAWRRRLLWLMPFSTVSGILATMIVVYRGAETADFIYFVF